MTKAEHSKEKIMAGNVLKNKRVGKGLTVRQLSEKSGVDKTTISELENGKRKAYPVTLGRLAKALELADWTELESLAVTRLQVGDESATDDGSSPKYRATLPETTKVA